MSEQNWLESRKKNSRRNTLIIILAVVASALSIIFIRNNHDLFFSKHERRSHVMDYTPPGDTARATEQPPSRQAQPSVPTDAPAHPSGTAAVSEGSEPKAAGGSDSVTIPDFACKVRDNAALRVILSLKIIFPSAGVKSEVLLKREDLKVMVQKTIAEEFINELNIDSLRERTKRAMNRILDQAVISDVEFKNFSIEKVQRP